MKKIFLEDLPKKGKRIDWEKSIGYSVKFIYEDVEGEFKIIDYLIDKKHILIEYLGIEKYIIQIINFKNCNFGKILNVRSCEFKYKIGTHFFDNNRNFIIIDKEYRKDKSNYNRKWYKYQCKLCGYSEGWFREDSIKRGRGCACCCTSSRVVVEGINDIPTTAPWMVKYFQGGYDEAKLYTKSSRAEINMICPDCGKIKKYKIEFLNRLKSISCICGDGFSFPEKIMWHILKSINKNFIMQYSPEWSGLKRYDFYVPSLNMIIETHGRQHYDGGFSRLGGRTLEEEQENDKIKEILAKENGIEHYISIDCRESDLDFIKNKILNSKISELFDLSNLDWNECEKFALNNIVKYICNIKKENPLIKIDNISNITGISSTSIYKYLKIGEALGWCFSKEDMIKEVCLSWGTKKYTILQLAQLFNLNEKTIRKYLNKGTELKLCNYNNKKSEILKKVCSYWNSGDYTIYKIGNLFDKSDSTIRNYLKEGETLGYCKYIKDNGKKVICLEDFKVFKSIKSASRFYNIDKKSIRLVCMGLQKTTHNKRFEFYNQSNIL